ncbi:MAG: hypothetical protein GF401_18095 [Chitinivibrionales bacterium]|nr:hypothetical protein [Chitinivibrionales bacterium]
MALIFLAFIIRLNHILIRQLSLTVIFHTGVMEIKSCLLQKYNDYPLGESTIGELIGRNGKDHLWEDRTDGNVDTIVIHYISANKVVPGEPFNRDLILGIFCEYDVSSHYLIERTGNILRLVPEEYKAWHCGGSIMPEPDNRQKVNDFSVGIELAGTESDKFTDEQYHSLQELLDHIEARYGGALKILGHSDVAGERAVKMGIRSMAKPDPGPFFDWKRLHQSHFEGHNGKIWISGK